MALDPIYGIAKQISLLVPDGTVLHQHIAAVSDDGPRVASYLPGSEVGSSKLADALARRELGGGTRPGFCAVLLAKLKAAQ